jgi:hypothetical protein
MLFGASLNFTVLGRAGGAVNCRTGHPNVYISNGLEAAPAKTNRSFIPPLSRRSFAAGTAMLVMGAPAIVRAQGLVKVRITHVGGVSCVTFGARSESRLARGERAKAFWREVRTKGRRNRSYGPRPSTRILERPIATEPLHKIPRITLAPIMVVSQKSQCARWDDHLSPGVAGGQLQWCLAVLLPILISACYSSSCTNCGESATWSYSNRYTL